VQRSNRDFVILDHDPVVVLMLVGFVGLVGLTIALLDDALDARLPHPSRRVGVPIVLYLAVTISGLVLILPIVVDFMMYGSEYRTQVRAGWGLACVGLCTLTWWLLRVRGRWTPPRALRMAGQASLLITVVLGIVTGLPHILGAAGMT
jgi:hypothetical protein